ncbi:MAG TPA: hypothetical protein VH255_02450 [Verrucomicrobiae bacterium]|jgi:hypothetical protein|nr:hypothetical protein [Verrucomicrobiae bacterium]
MKIKITAKATVLDEAGSPIKNAARLHTLDGVAHDECFSDYLLDDPDTKALPAKGVSGGYLRFRFRVDRQELWAETEYDLSEPLTDADTKAIVAYTAGQWSDGIGENFSQSYADENDLFISIESDQAHIKTV